MKIGTRVYVKSGYDVPWVVMKDNKGFRICSYRLDVFNSCFSVVKKAYKIV